MLLHNAFGLVLIALDDRIHDASVVRRRRHQRGLVGAVQTVPSRLVPQSPNELNEATVTSEPKQLGVELDVGGDHCGNVSGEGVTLELVAERAETPHNAVAQEFPVTRYRDD